jgi:CP family cyanate transporter-like MFS transporter
VNDDPNGAVPVVVDRLTTEPRLNPTRHDVIGRRRVLHLLAALLLLALTLRTAVTGLSPLLPRVAAGVPLSAAEAGLVGSLPPFSFAAAGLIGPALLRRVAAERLVVLAMVFEGLGLVIRPWSGGPGPFIAFSVVALLGMGLGNVVLPVLVKAWFPHRIPAVTSMYVMGITFGTSFPALLAVPVADAAARVSGSQRIGWQVGLTSWAVLCVLVALAWWWPALHPRAVPAPDAAASATVVARAPMWRSRTAWGITLIFAANSLSSYALFAWLPTRLTDAGVSDATAGVMLAVFGGMGVPAALLAPTLAARGRHTFLLVLQFAVAFALGELALLLTPAHLTLLWVVLAGWGSGAFPLTLALIGLRSRTPAGAGALSGFAQGIGYFVAGFGPIAVGVLHGATGGWTAPFAVLIGILAVMLVGGALVAKPHSVEDELERVGKLDG